MRKIPEVETAKALMAEAHDWSLWRWLFEKKRLRQTSDQANAALTTAEEEVKGGWNADLKKAYAEVAAQDCKKKKTTGSVDPELLSTLRHLREAFENAERIRLAAEETFSEAERRLNTDIAKEGTVQAVEAWILREKAIRKAGSLGKNKN
jgi:hypothetical protein